MHQGLKFVVLYASLHVSITSAERSNNKKVASIGGVARASLRSFTPAMSPVSHSTLKLISKREDPADGKAETDVAATPAEEPKAKTFDIQFSKSNAIYLGIGIMITAVVFCSYLLLCGGRKSDKAEEEKTTDASTAASTADADPAADEETIALSDTLLRELVCRSLQRVGPALAKGQALQNTVERSIQTITGRAQQLLMTELNCAAGSICKTLDAEEAMLILDWDAAVRANFPALTVLLAGVLAPTVLQFNLYGHIAIVALLLFPVLLLCLWAIWQDYGVPCDAIPTLFWWLYAQAVLALVLCLARLIMVWQIRAGQAKLQEKAEEFQAQRKGKRVIGSMDELQELFVSHSVLVQHALLIEESVANSLWNKIVGVGTFAWIVVTLWGTVLVLGWTFIPGLVAFHQGAAQAVGADAYCGAWATVFVARLVVIIGILFFLVNTLSVLSWASTLAMGTAAVQGKARHWARTFDAKFQGLPVMQALFKAFVLPRELDTASAELAAQLHEQNLLEQEKATCEARLQELKDQLEAQKKRTKNLESSVSSDPNNKLEEKLALLEKRSRSAMDAGEWKKHGTEAIERAKANAMTLEEASTAELERVFTRIQEAANQLQNSETTKEMLQRAQVAAGQLQDTAQSSMQAGKEKLKEFSESEQGKQVQAAVQSAGASAAAAAEKTATAAKSQAEKMQEQKGKKK
eukprot:gnl/MRDRNA2_/MRDRNA2_93700_c0_seq1.p1 gnl/MRDRNA2_/MRDRNA2_93700_c0~~gnl/MRDRNA2_/MRDRNA2_93700_c0_seq1.p1  ORF type:complete len:693 (-),score=169.23 gnl/MRDRNA2_/MRDRNA2_93700_c0_seq1:8-2086(-)